MSSIAWLDTSAEEQRRVREVVALFTQKDTLDELGIGQIRDMFSDAMFPGITTIETRARYFLLVPWAYVKESKPGRSAAEVRARVQESERALISTLNRQPHQEGVIGARAGAGVKNLPSTIYWNGLLTFGILRRDIGLDQLVGRRQRERAEELATRDSQDWHPTLPPVPKDFPSSLEGGLAMTAPEASWLRERILDSVPDTLLAHVVAADRPPSKDSPSAWHDEVCGSAPEMVAEILHHAHLFSLVVNGATRLYNVLVAEAYEQAGFNAISSSVEDYRRKYADWLAEVDDTRHQLQAWDDTAFWHLVRERNPRVAPRTETFVRTWVAAVRDGRAATAPDDGPMRALVGNRERSLKGRQSRLANEKLLGQWGGGGSGGSGGLDYRWGTVKRIVTDIHDGLARV